jgi:hypothetical protein
MRSPLLLGAAAGFVLVVQASLKDLQRAVRERLLSEAGTSELVYTRVDFSHCAATIQTRTLKSSGSREVRLTTTFQLAAITVVSGKDLPQLILKGEGPGSAFRQIEQAIDSGKIRERVSAADTLAFQFQRNATARQVGEGFTQISKLCKDDDPLHK